MSFKSGFLQDVVRDMKNGVFDFTKNGECSNCGSCCSDFLPISGKEIKNIKKYIRKKNIKEQKHVIPTSRPAIDFTCPFRNDSKRRCEIYSVRPAICRDFKCDKPKKQIKADKSMYHGKYCVISMRKEFFKED